MIRVEHLDKSFGTNHVLKDISVEYEPGQCNMVIGRSGCGKTVLLKSIIGLVEPDSGEVWYGDRRLADMTGDQRRHFRRGIGVLFQNSALFDFATVLENVMFPMNFFSDMTLDEKLERARFCLRRVDVQGAEDKFPSELSGGMQKRVGIARAIVLNPHYLFCDEPNSGLDPQTSILIDQLISELTREYGMTTVINTHDMNSILEIGDKIGFMHQGSLVWQGSKDDILATECTDLREFIRANTLVRRAMDSV